MLAGDEDYAVVADSGTDYSPGFPADWSLPRWGRRNAGGDPRASPPCLSSVATTDSGSSLSAQSREALVLPYKAFAVWKSESGKS